MIDASLNPTLNRRRFQSHGYWQVAASCWPSTCLAQPNPSRSAGKLLRPNAWLEFTPGHLRADAGPGRNGPGVP